MRLLLLFVAISACALDTAHAVQPPLKKGQTASDRSKFSGTWNLVDPQIKLVVGDQAGSSADAAIIIGDRVEPNTRGNKSVRIGVGNLNKKSPFIMQLEGLYVVSHQTAIAVTLECEFKHALGATVKGIEVEEFATPIRLKLTITTKKDIKEQDRHYVDISFTSDKGKSHMPEILWWKATKGTTKTYTYEFAKEDKSATGVSLRSKTLNTAFKNFTLASNSHDQENYTWAIFNYTQAIRHYAESDVFYAKRADCYDETSKPERSIADFSKAIELNPTRYEYFTMRGAMHSAVGKYDLGIADLTTSIRLSNGKYYWAYHCRAYAYNAKQDYAKAIDDYEQNLKLKSDDIGANNDLAWLLATCPIAKHRDGEKAVRYATKACSLSNNDPLYMDTLAAAHAESGMFKKAVSVQRKALESAGDVAKETLDEMRMHLKLFMQNKPVRGE